ncbi:MAG: sigma-54 dependent transcriptional regulator [Nitrospira sp. BO4]|jgi:DNA-binding NtrC family response regulator|nr:sigma-54 dependent transcriptional regulator [Nitrospira sp. BO4]
MHAKILIVDDENDIRMSLENRVTWMGHEPLIATDVASALRLIREEVPDLVLLDLKLGQESGLEVLRQVRDMSHANQPKGEATPPTSGTYTTPLIVILTAFGTIELAVQAMQLGAFDFVPKPFTADHLTVVIKKALETVALHHQFNRLRKEVDDQLDPIVATNKHMAVQLACAKKAAASTATVLLLGETGTGKEILARAIHRWSPRAHKPFVAVNCAAIPETLIESELFGHEKGAFTGAASMKRGQFEEADGGTLFLDEIGDMSMSTQAKVLRALQDQVFTRVGGTKSVKVDLRVLAATNKDLRQAIRQGTFREDLYFRLAVITVTPPPLRERMDDLLALAQHFISSRPVKLGLQKRFVLSDVALEALQHYSWPGNIRELENVISRALVLCTGDTIEPEDLLLPDAPTRPRQEPDISADGQTVFHSYHESMDAHSRKLIENALIRNGWNQTKAAAELGLQRTYLTKLLRQKRISGRPPTSPSFI